jgi:hypothetical protein
MSRWYSNSTSCIAGKLWIASCERKGNQSSHSIRVKDAHMFQLKALKSFNGLSSQQKKIEVTLVKAPAYHQLKPFHHSEQEFN